MVCPSVSWEAGPPGKVINPSPLTRVPSYIPMITLTGDIGPDRTHESDIVFARWGDAKNPKGNYTVWPIVKPLKQVSRSFPFTLTGDQTTHRFIWDCDGVSFQSSQGHCDYDRQEINARVYSPRKASRYVSQKAMPVHINLWLFQGLPPKTGREVEVIIHDFKFTPE